MRLPVQRLANAQIASPGLRGMPQNARTAHPYPPTLCTKHKDGIVTCKRQTVYPLWKRHNRLLVSLLPAIHMHDSLLGLRRENVRCAHGEAVGRRCALLEYGSLRRQRLELVEEDGGIFGMC